MHAALDGQTGQFAALRWKAAEQGALLPNPSSTKESSFCDNTAKDRPWPLSEVCGLVEGIPVVLLDASEGLRSASGKREFFYTGEVFLTLRCLRALGWSQVGAPVCATIQPFQPETALLCRRRAAACGSCLGAGCFPERARVHSNPRGRRHRRPRRFSSHETRSCQERSRDTRRQHHQQWQLGSSSLLD